MSTAVHAVSCACNVQSEEEEGERMSNDWTMPDSSEQGNELQPADQPFQTTLSTSLPIETTDAVSGVRVSNTRMVLSYDPVSSTAGLAPEVSPPTALHCHATDCTLSVCAEKERNALDEDEVCGRERSHSLTVQSAEAEASRLRATGFHESESTASTW